MANVRVDIAVTDSARSAVGTCHFDDLGSVDHAAVLEKLKECLSQVQADQQNIVAPPELG